MGRDSSDEEIESPPPAPISVPGVDRAVTAEVVRKIVEDARSYFASRLRNKEGREAYKQWLFKLVRSCVRAFCVWVCG